MILFLIAYLGGALTILSPCILPVLPFVFAKSDTPFLRSGLPLLLGMALTFAGVASLAALGGGWAVQANQYGRVAALLLLAVFGLTLLSEGLAERLMRPLVRLGSRLSVRVSREGSGALPSFLLGIATGLLWAPCAGPILGLLLTGAALQGASATTTALLLAYALGAATSLALALLVGGRLFRLMKKSLGVGEWIRRGLGVAVLAGVAAITLGLDTGILARLSLANTSHFEQALLEHGMADMEQPQVATNGDLPDEGPMPSLDGAVEWLNSPPLTAESLRGKVVLVDFWTYSCINCLRSLPYVKAWADKYKDDGLVVIGVHAPEFAFERDVANVKNAVKELGLSYPVAVDNNYAIWQAFNNHYWPAHYFIDARGRVRYHHFGEGDYEQSEKIIRELLHEAGQDVAEDMTHVNAGGVQAASREGDVDSPETYIGYERAEHFAGVQAMDSARVYDLPGALALNQWGFSGNWTVGPEHAVANQAGARIAYRFHARDLHLVLGPSDSGESVPFRVTMDGKPLKANHGVDTDENGNGVVREQRLYQLIRQNGSAGDHTFEIEFLAPGVQAFAFTFG